MIPALHSILVIDSWKGKNEGMFCLVLMETLWTVIFPSILYSRTSVYPIVFSAVLSYHLLVYLRYKNLFVHLYVDLHVIYMHVSDLPITNMFCLWSVAKQIKIKLNALDCLQIMSNLFDGL